MSERAKASRIVRAALLVGLGFTAACGGDSEPAEPSFRLGDDAAELMDSLYTSGDVLSCEGQSGLRLDGHVRTEPTSDVSGNQYNILREYNNGKGNVILQDPQRIDLANPGSEAAREWYVLQMPNEQKVFVNRNALVEDNFECSDVTTPESPLGPIEFAD